MSDAPDKIWTNCDGNTQTWLAVPNRVHRVEYIRRDAPELVALVEAARAMRAFDAMPLECKRPDVFELRVRQPLLRAIAAYEALK